MTIIASSALAATFAAVAMTSADAQACTTCPGDLVEAFATTDLSGSYIDLKPIGMVETDSNGFTSLKPIGYWATGTDGSVELKPIGSEHQDSFDFAWTVQPEDVSTSFREASTDLAGLKPIGIIELDDDGFIGLKPIGMEETDASGYVDLKPIGLDYQDGDTISLKPIGSEMAIGDATDMIGLKPIGIIETDSDGYLDVQQMGEINVDSSGTVELPANSRYSSTVDYSSMYTSERLLSGGR
jgi:hypothetical protein